LTSDESSRDQPAAAENGDAEEPTVRTKEEVARIMGAKPAGTHEPAIDEDALREGGRLRLDKSGALANRPKLKPVRPHRRDEGGPAPDPTESRRPREETPGAGPRRAVLPPRIGSLRPEGFEAPEPPAVAESGPEIQEVEIPAGTFLYGDARKPRDLPAFHIDTFPVSHGDYEAFVEATGHRPPLYWPDGRLQPELRDHPVVGVDYYDALAYAWWRGRDLPFEDEWERAARGTDGRVYPWGNDQELSGANTARVGLKMTVPVDLHRANVSPDGCRDMVGNVWEMTHSPAPGGGVVVRGGSWYDFALYAKTFFRFASRPDARNGTIGFRTCRRAEERPDATREVPLDQVEAEIAARRGPQAPVDRSEWSLERRDLLPDLGRLRTHVAEVRAEDLLAPKRGVAVTLQEPSASEPAVPEAPVEEAPAPEPPEPAAEEAAPPPPEPEEEPVHVSDAVGSVRPVEHVPPVDREAVREAARRTDHAGPAVHRAATAPAVRSSRAMPAYMWVLLAAGFLLFGGLLAVLVNQDDDARRSDGPPPAPPAASHGALADLPEPLPYAEFPGANESPIVHDLAQEAHAERLLEGTWLMVFADVDSSAGQQSLEAAHAMHRRLAPHGVRVAAVLPRTAYANAEGELPDPETLARRLKVAGRNLLWDAIHVVLDPRDEPDGQTRLQAVHCRADEPVCAVLLRDGLRESRTSLPEGGFTQETLASLARRALDLTAR
jgi:hypothetical protein